MPTSSLPRHVDAPSQSADRAGALLVVAGVLIVAQAAFRAWALYAGWFSQDDFIWLRDAQVNPLDREAMLKPHNGHLMPGARVLAEVVVAHGSLSWTAAASLVLGLQIAASVACWWMLVSLFGIRPGAVALLLLYLTSALAVPALHWWIAALNALPLQLAFFLTVGATARYLRVGQLRWLCAAALALCFGLFFWQKAILILPVVGALAVGWYAEGGPLARLGTLVRTRWPAVVVGVLLGVGYTAAYLALTDQGSADSGTQASFSANAALVQNAVGTSFATGVLGGPWRWADEPRPAVGVDPPVWTTQLAWVVLAAIIVYAWLRRTGTLRAWLLLAGYIAADVALIVWGRSGGFGPQLGLQLRYLTDVLPVAVLSAGLAFLPLTGAIGSSRPRRQPLLIRPAPPWLTLALVLGVALGGVTSSVEFARIWHSTNASKPYLDNLRKGLAVHGAVDLADAPVPEGVLTSLFAPDNKVSTLAPLAGADLMKFPQDTAGLAAVAPNGEIGRADIQLGVESVPGPKEDCGWTVTDRGRYIPLAGEAFEWTWWVRIGYLSGSSSPVTVVAGDSEVTTEVQRGLHELFVRVDGSFDDVRIEGLDRGATMCVDTVEVGQAVPGGAWE